MKDSKPKVTVLNDTEDAPELLASAIKDVSSAAKKLLNGPLRRRALLVLIQDNIRGSIAMRDIEAVLDSAVGLEGRYVVKKQESSKP